MPQTDPLWAAAEVVCAAVEAADWVASEAEIQAVSEAADWAGIQAQ